MGQINLNNFKVITDKLNTFFVDNKFMVTSEIPTEGEFKVGDIIINNGPTNVDEPMWICVEAGNPGTWTVFNSGGGSGGRLSTARNRVVLNGESKSEVSIGVSGFNKASDVLMVFINSRFMTEGVDYEINDDSTKIVAIGEAWNEELASEFEIEMIVFKIMGEEGVVSSVNEIVKLKNTVVVNEAVNEVEIGIEGFNEGDDLTVYRNSVYMIEGIDYEVQGSKIVSLKGAWNAEGGSDYKFTFEVLKTVAKVNPDAVVGMEHLTEDVKEAIEAAGNIDLSGKQDKTDNGLVTTDKTIVGAINELFQNANNGKELIASAIGEPLSSEDTFSAMSNDINGLLSTFKTNMMKNGITVNSGDKFKALIDKIATLADNEGKGIQYVEGGPIKRTNNAQSFTHFSGGAINLLYTDITNLTFTPTILIVTSIDKSDVLNVFLYNDPYLGSQIVKVVNGNNIYILKADSSVFRDNSVIRIPVPDTYGQMSFKWTAIGVGEEDTTLRDSLASILQEEGVEVTEEDDMASLIGKVDEEFNRKNNEIENSGGGLDIISATELPATGKENQICVITENPVDKYIVTHDYDYSDTTNIILYNGSKNSAPLINMVSGSVTQQYYITKIIQNDKYKLLESYYWSSNQWNSLTKSYVIIVQDGVVQNKGIIGGIKSQPYVMSYDSMSGSLLTPYSTAYSDSYVGATTTKKIDFGKYSTVTITAKVSNGSRQIYVGTSTYSDNMAGESTVYLDNFFTKYVSKNLTSTSYVDLTFDISSYTGEHYLAFGFSKASNGGASNVYIKDIKLS